MARLISIGAGKGGVGKTFVSSSIGITLSKLGHSVLVIDCDFAGANVHTALGMKPSEQNLQSYFSVQAKLETLVQATTIPRLSCIHGIWDEWAPNELSVEDARQLVSDSKKMNFDFVIIDLGPGATRAHVEIFKNSDEKILISSAEPTSIEKTYRFIEAFIVSKLESAGTKDAIKSLKADLKKYRQTQKKGHFSFRKYLSEVTGFSFDHFDSLNEKPIRLIINGSRSHQDQQLGFSIKTVCNKYFDLLVDYTGFVDYDNAVWQSIRNKEPFLIEKPFTPLSGQFFSICKSILNSETNANTNRAVV